MARRRRRLSLTPGEVRLYEHFLEHPHPTIKGRFEPLTPTVGHQLAPTVVPVPAAVPPGVRVDRYGGITGGQLGASLATQYQLNPLAAAEGVISGAGIGVAGAPPAVTNALKSAGILDLVERERLKRLAASEPIHPDILAEAIANTALTAGIGGLAGLGRGAVEAGVEGAASAGAGAAEGTAGRSATQILADAARSVRQAPQAARDAVEALATTAGQRAAAQRAAGGAADFLLEHPKVTQVGGVGAVGAVTGKKEGGLQIPTALLQGTARALEPAHIGNTALATGRGLAGAITGPAALLYSAGESALTGSPNPFLNTAKAQGQGILDIFGKLLSGNPDVVQSATENEVGLSLLPLLPKLGDTALADRAVGSVRDFAKETRGAINRRLGTDLRYGPEDQNVFGLTQRRGERRQTAEEAQHEAAGPTLQGHANHKDLEKAARRIEHTRSLSNLHGFDDANLLQTLADTGLRRPEHIDLVRKRFPGRNEDALPRDVNLHRVLDELERRPEALKDPALLRSIEEYRGIQHRTPQHLAGEDRRAAYSAQAHILGVHDAVERIPKAIERLLPKRADLWSREDAWRYVQAGEDQLRDLRREARDRETNARVLGARVKEIERDERRRQRAAGAKVVSTDAPRRSDLPRGNGEVVRPATKTRGPAAGDRRLPESARLQREKAKLVDAQAEARAKRAEAKSLERHLEEIKKGPGSEEGLNAYTRPHHAVSSRARRKLWSPEMVDEMVRETDAAAALTGFDKPIWSHHGETIGGRAETAAGPRGGNIRATAVPHVRRGPYDEASLAARDEVGRGFQEMVEGSIEAPRRKEGLQKFAQRFFSKHHIAIRVKSADGVLVRKGRVTQDAYQKAIDRGEISSKGHVWVPESEYKQPFLQAKDLEPAGAEVAAGVAEKARTGAPGSYGLVMPKERWEEYKAQVEPGRGVAERFFNLTTKAAGRILLFSPAWIETQAIAELLPMVMARPRLVLDPTYAARMARAVKRAEDVDIEAKRGWAGTMGESPVRSASASELAPGYQPRTHAMFSDAVRAVQHTLPGRALFSLAQLRPFIIFDQWRQGKYRQVLAAAELDKELNGFANGLQRALKAQRTISDELKGRPLEEAIVETYRNPRYRQLLEEQAKGVEDVMGNWTAFTRFERKFSPALIFYGFLRYALRWPLTFARRHPVSAQINYFLAQANANELEKMLGGKPAEFYQYANPVTRNGADERQELPVGSRIAPGLSAPTQGVLEQNLPGAAVGSLNPAYAALVGLLTGTNSFGQYEEDIGALGAHWSTGAKQFVSGPPILRLLGVGASNSETSKELLENDPHRKERSFAEPWIPLGEDAARANNDLIKGIEEYQKAKADNGGFPPSSAGSGGNPYEGAFGSGGASQNPYEGAFGGGSAEENPYAGSFGGG